MSLQKTTKNLVLNIFFCMIVCLFTFLLFHSYHPKWGIFKHNTVDILSQINLCLVQGSVLCIVQCLAADWLLSTRYQLQHPAQGGNQKSLQTLPNIPSGMAKYTPSHCHEKLCPKKANNTPGLNNSKSFQSVYFSFP